MNLEARRMVPLKHLEKRQLAPLAPGWLPRWSAKKERQLARRARRHEADLMEAMLRNAPPPAFGPTVPPPKPLWQRITDRARRFLSRRTA